jgi:hypothetical protein
MGLVYSDDGAVSTAGHGIPAIPWRLHVERKRGLRARPYRCARVSGPKRRKTRWTLLMGPQ